MGRYENVRTETITHDLPGNRTLAARLILSAQHDHPLNVPGLEDGLFLRASMHIGEIGRDKRFYEGIPVVPNLALLDAVSHLISKVTPLYTDMARQAEERRVRLTDLRRAAENDAKGDQKEGMRHTGKTQKERDKRKAKMAGNQ